MGTLLHNAAFLYLYPINYTKTLIFNSIYNSPIIEALHATPLNVLQLLDSHRRVFPEPVEGVLHTP